MVKNPALPIKNVTDYLHSRSRKKDWFALSNTVWGQRAINEVSAGQVTLKEKTVDAQGEVHWLLSTAAQDEGDPCPCSNGYMRQCEGEMIWQPRDNECGCLFTRNPPCSNCENGHLECCDCGWQVGERVDNFTNVNKQPAEWGSW